ncbi:hypothetical protein C3L33_15358, partial [Rhododendron williamsianum]
MLRPPTARTPTIEKTDGNAWPTLLSIKSAVAMNPKKNIFLSSRNNVDEAVEKLRARGIEVLGVVCHVSNAQQRKNLIETTVQKYGKIDVIVSNAAVNPSVDTILETKEAVLDKLWEINVKASILLLQKDETREKIWDLMKGWFGVGLIWDKTRKDGRVVVYCQLLEDEIYVDATPHLQKGSSVIFISSITAYQPPASLAMYGVTKTALLGLTKALAAEMAPDTRVNCVAPGFVPTRFADFLTSNDEIRKSIEEKTLLNRLGTTEDMAAATAFLASDDASYITGETLVVGGGAPSRLYLKTGICVALNPSTPTELGTNPTAHQRRTKAILESYYEKQWRNLVRDFKGRWRLLRLRLRASASASLSGSARKAPLLSSHLNNVDEAVEKLRARGIEVLGVKYGKIDVIVSNAAVNPSVDAILETKEAVLDKLWEINVKAAILLLQDATPHLQKGSSVIFISSAAGYQPLASLAMYGVTKTALLGLTKALAAEMAPDTRVNCVAPGFVPTRFADFLTTNDETRMAIEEKIILNRLGTTEDMAAATAFLASDDASYITGETLVVAGGAPSRL